MTIPFGNHKARHCAHREFSWSWSNWPSSSYKPLCCEIYDYSFFEQPPFDPKPSAAKFVKLSLLCFGLKSIWTDSSTFPINYLHTVMTLLSHWHWLDFHLNTPFTNRCSWPVPQPDDVTTTYWLKAPEDDLTDYWQAITNFFDWQFLSFLTYRWKIMILKPGYLKNAPIH